MSLAMIANKHGSLSSLHIQSGLCLSDLGLVLAEVWQGEGRLWVDEIMVDVSLRRHKHQATANTG